MKTGMALIDRQELVATDEEISLIRQTIKDMHFKTITEWVAKQKPKIRAKFTRFLTVILESNNEKSDAPSSNISERFAKDITKQQYHESIKSIIDHDTGDFTDVLHLLSIHMSRANVMASIPAKRDTTPKLLRAIAQEDHLFSAKKEVKHQNPPPIASSAMTRETLNEKLQVTANTRAKTCKPAGERSCPFAQFPTGDTLESTMHREFKGYQKQEKPKQTSVFNVLNSPTCV